MKAGYQLVILVLLGFIVYGNSLANDFVFDDDQITNNPLFKTRAPFEFFTKGGLFYQGDITQASGYIYRPVSLALFRLTYSVFGPSPIAFHLLPIVLHIATTVLLFLLLKLAFPSTAAFLVALIFLVHPSNSEVVAYISPVSDILFVFFGTAALLVAFRNFTPGVSRQTRLTALDAVRSAASGHTPGVFLAVLLLFSLLSKETGILFCLLIPATYFIFKIKNYALWISPLAATALYLILRVLIAGVGLSPGAVTPIAQASLAERLLSMPKIAFYYLKSFFLPLDLSSGQHWVIRNADFANFWIPLFAVLTTIAVMALIWFKVQKENGPLAQIATFYLLWLFLGFILHLQIFPLEYTVAQRWLYFVKIGFIGFAAASALYLLQNTNVAKKSKSALAVAFCIILLALSLRTFFRNFDWRDNLTLTAQDLKTNKDSFELELVYGTEQLKLKNYQGAKDHLEKSVSLNPYWLNVNNLATAYLGAGKKEEALLHFRDAAYTYGYYKSYENLASIYLLDGKLEQSRAVLDDAFKLYPNDPKLWYIASLYFEKSGQDKQAKVAREKYLNLKQPD